MTRALVVPLMLVALLVAGGVVWVLRSGGAERTASRGGSLGPQVTWAATPGTLSRSVLELRAGERFDVLDDR
jgi:hypothetical protein